jgi:hypothetical protein
MALPEGVLPSNGTDANDGRVRYSDTSAVPVLGQELPRVIDKNQFVQLRTIRGSR